MRKQSRDKLLEPQRGTQRPKRKRGKRKITLQVKCTDKGRTWSFWSPGKGDPDADGWYEYEWKKYNNLRDARNAVTSLSQGFYGKHCSCIFRVNPKFEEQQ